MASDNLERITTWCQRIRLPFHQRADAVWLPNPAAPRYGVLIREVDAATEWSMPFPIPAQPDCIDATRRALTCLDQRSGPGVWELQPDRTVRYRLHMPVDRLADEAALMAGLRAVLDAGNDHVHGLVEVMAGREPPEYVQTASAGAPAGAEPITLDRLTWWSELLCKLGPLDAADAMATLGVAGATVRRASAYLVVEPAPRGASSFALALEHLGPNTGYLSSVQVVPDVLIRRRDLDQRFGVGSGRPPLHAGGPYVVSYDVQVAGAPFRAELSALFYGHPDADPANEIRIRRDPVRRPRE